eukprot:1268014-Rhodomonas_salina.1
MVPPGASTDIPYGATGRYVTSGTDVRRFVARICAALSARLKTPAQSDVGQSEAAHVRALQ